MASKRMAPRECPECGLTIDPRGLAGHRRLKHGEDAARQPDSAERERQASQAVLEALGAIDRSIWRVEARLMRLEAQVEELAGGARDAARAEAESERQRMQRELDHLLQTIAAEKALAADEAARRGRPARTDEELLQETAFHQRLGRLNRRRYSLLFRLSEESKGAGPDFSSFGAL